MSFRQLLAKNKMMRYAGAAIFGAAMLISNETAQAQGGGNRPPASPASEASGTVGGKALTIKYSAPSLRGRKVFADTGRIAKDRNFPIWRAGANSATSLHTEGDLKIGDVDVPKGDYTLYVDLSSIDKWELVISKQTGQWGLTYSKDQDLGRTKMTMAKPSAPVETLKYTITGSGNKGTIKLEWDNYAATVPVTSK